MGERNVNSLQLEVLDWIVAGCPDGVMTGTTYKTTAIALQNRRLVTVSKKGGVWKAVATDAGRYFAANRSYPNGHWTAPAKPQSDPRTSPPPRPTLRRDTPLTTLRPVDQVLADIEAAGGVLEVADGSGYYQNLVSSATRHGKVPDGKILQVVHGRRWGEKTLRLVDKPAWMPTAVSPIPIAERLVKPHPAVAALRADREHRLRFKRDVRQRALLILDALAKESTRRAYAVTCPTADRHQRNQPADLLIEINGHPHAIHVNEDTDKVPHEATAKELRDLERWGYPRIPKYDKVPSGRLTIAVNGGIPVRQSTFSDTKTINLADRLSDLLQELELRAAAAEERRLDREREAEAKRRAWQQARDEAVIAFREDHRSQILAKQNERWQRAQQLGEYLHAMEAHIATLHGEAAASATEWLTWARAHVDTLNPLTGDPALRLPDTPDPTPDALKPFMRGLSPYGPERTYGW